MDTQQRNQNYNHVYDCSTRGFDTTFWDNYAGGIPTIGAGVFNLNEQSIVTLDTFVYADITVNSIVFPTEPTAGDDRVIGFYASGLDNKGRITFSVEDDEFHARVYDNNGDSLFDLAIEWDGDWTGELLDLRIIWTEMGVKFFVTDPINGEVCKAIYATDGSVNKIKPDLARGFVIANSNADGLEMSGITIKNAHSVS